MTLFKFDIPVRGRPKATPKPDKPKPQITFAEKLYKMRAISHSRFKNGILFRRLAISVYQEIKGPSIAMYSSQKTGHTADLENSQFKTWKKLTSAIIKNCGRSAFDNTVTLFVDNEPITSLLDNSTIDRSPINDLCRSLDLVGEILSSTA